MDRIYIKENQPKVENSSSKWVIIAAAVLVLLGIGGLIYSLSNSSQNQTPQNTSSTDTATESDTVDDTTDTRLTDAENTDTDVDNDDTDTDTDTDTTTNTGSTAPTYTAPSDTTKINIYFSKSPESDSNPSYYYPVLRDKPADKTQSFVITQTLNGPTSAEQAQGYKKSWSFSGSSQCGGSLYRFNMSGTTMTLTICKDFSGESTKLEEALLHSLSEVSTVKKVEVVNASGEAI